MKRIIMMILIAFMCLSFTGCWMTEMFRKGGQQAERLKVNIQREWLKLEEVALPFVTMYDAGKVLYDKGNNLYTLGEDEEGAVIPNDRFNNADSEVQEWLLNVKSLAEEIDMKVKDAVIKWKEIAAKKEKTLEDLEEAEEAFAKMEKASKDVTSFFSSAAKIISKAI